MDRLEGKYRDGGTFHIIFALLSSASLAVEVVVIIASGSRTMV